MKISFDGKDYDRTLVIKNEICQIDTLVFGELSENEIPGVIRPGFIRNMTTDGEDEFIFTYKINNLQLVDFDKIKTNDEMYKLLKSLTERLETSRSYMLSLSCLLNDYIFKDKENNIYLIFLPIYKLDPQNDLKTVYQKFLSSESFEKNCEKISELISENVYSLKNIDIKLDEFFKTTEVENKAKKKTNKITLNRILDFFKI